VRIERDGTAIVKTSKEVHSEIFFTDLVDPTPLRQKDNYVSLFLQRIGYRCV
jgi:hypothetical protein